MSSYLRDTTIVGTGARLDPRLDTDQREALGQLRGSTHAITAFRGGAGTGKSFVLRQLVDQVMASGRPVMVLAPQRQQVVEMEQAGFPKPATVAQFLLQRELPQEFEGILGCDYYAAYRKYARQCSVLVQFCLAHLIREVKYLCEFPDPRVQHYGKALLGGLKALFGTLHRKDQLSPQAVEAELGGVYERIWRAALPGSGDHDHRLIRNMATRFAKHGEAYFQFITTPGIDPTNNVAEQAMRFVVIDRHVTQGTRSARGRSICERLWTVMATCALNKQSAFQWMSRAITAYFNGEPAPSLIPDSS